ncbi:MAG: dipeptidase PepV [Eubacteriaceae bacterium]|nr:dipeptidase PepV [Eubacteriaceae bacterium]
MEFKEEIRKNMPILAEDISALCKINSVEGEPQPGMPFGEGPAKALNAMLEIGEKMGFKTTNYGNIVGEIEYGDGEEMLGILGHVDVVPAGEGWDKDPWGGEISDGTIWGRGTLDDKGPMLTCLYALKILKDLDVKLDKRVRLIIGTNEETDWKCMDYYLNEVKPELPTYAFSPDSHFPVTYAEMGMLQFRLTRKLSEKIRISGGNAFNSVPSKATVVLPAAMEAEVEKAISASSSCHDYEYSVEGDELTLTTNGVGAHAAYLGEGKNAISYMMELLGTLPIEGELKEIVDFYNERFGTLLYGEKLGIACSDEDCGPLTLNIGKLYTEEGKLVIELDSRIPVSYPVADIEKKVINIFADTEYEYSVASVADPLYVPKDSKLVETLMESYRKITGDVDSVPRSSGGATYSRTIDNCVAFGCLLPEQIDTMHQANECLELKHLEIWLAICLEAIYQLAK